MDSLFVCLYSKVVCSFSNPVALELMVLVCVQVHLATILFRTFSHPFQGNSSYIYRFLKQIRPG